MSRRQTPSLQCPLMADIFTLISGSYRCRIGELLTVFIGNPLEEHNQETFRDEVMKKLPKIKKLDAWRSEIETACKRSSKSLFLHLLLGFVNNLIYE
ncbi:hypothetical protein EGR_02471 [Echinococcus granulosus]|uniref:Uncharacterized protein n=1 Tax=Echinococcus granulosus TaxID=6210 RepID=W6UMB4_ECHGR|nr:hypothetical protein EGR_02471 [Echinococcus granulosus]EUB62675.1 hypothetical protein EGR_02471 [Echinococcus granulosus]